MPISGPASYPPTADEFISHWHSANTDLGAAGPISLVAAATVATLTTLRTTLGTQRAAVESARNEVESNRADINAAKAALLTRLNQFNGKLQSLAPDSRWTAMLPYAFSISEGMANVLTPLDDLADLWARYDDAETPIILIGGYARAAFGIDLGVLKDYFTATSAAANGLGLARGKRTETEVKIHAILKAYRQRIPSEFAAGSAILETLPRLSPLPGHTPPAPVLSGTLDPATDQAVLAWGPSADPAVTTFQLRASVGPDYEAEDDVIIDDFPAAGPHTWTGSFGLDLPGTAATFKLYALTAEGNEKGSNSVTLTRPA